MTGIRKTEGSGVQQTTRRLADLLAGVDYQLCSGSSVDTVLISSITADSRCVRPGSLFCALPGTTTDGHHYIDEAIRADAAALIIERNIPQSDGENIQALPIIRVKDSQQALGAIAASFYADPADQMKMIGITGTNGKTTVSYLLEHVLKNAGFSAGVIGTVEYRYHDKDGILVHYPAPFTTPDPVRFHAILREMADQGVTHVVMEVSSHALQQQRLGPVHFELGLFTNLSQDHLDYHGTMANYFAAKRILFERYMGAGATAVIMLPDPGDTEKADWAGEIVTLCEERGIDVVQCGSSPQARFSCIESECTLDGLAVKIQERAGRDYLINSSLVGRFNGENLLISLAALVSLGLETVRAAEMLSQAEAAPGRLQRIHLAGKPSGQPTVLVDYAHTPDALEKALQSVLELEHNTLFCVVGCGGDRDRGKRPLMGRIAARMSDVAIITDDNPRSEDPAEIRAEILAGITKDDSASGTADWLDGRTDNGKGVYEIGDRQKAIMAAVSAAGPKDIVLIAGKGHETYQITVSGKRYFDDGLAAQQSSLLWDLETVAQATGGRGISRNGFRRFPGVSTDSRTIKDQDIFVALEGESFDGHHFLDKAIGNGAGCAVISESGAVDAPTVSVVEVSDTLQALGDLARWRRKAVKDLQNPVVVGLTGSSGKTTVKEMTAAIFSSHWPEQQDQPSDRVIKTAGNFNNLIGLPLTLMPVSAQHRGLVLEMGMNQPGEIARLTEIADPDIACILNIHGAHLEGLGTIEGVARAKGELFDNSSERAVHVINLDDDLVVGCAAKHRQRTVGFAVTAKGRARNPDVWADNVIADDDGHLSFTLHAITRKAEVKIYAPGLHNSSNACAAAAIGIAAGIDFPLIVEGLESFRSAMNRMVTLLTPKGLNVLNDTYNANPASMASALATLADLPAVGRAAILGDMLELGPASGELHEEIGRQAAQLNLDYLCLIGTFAIDLKRGARAGGMAEDRITLAEEKKRAVDWTADLMHSGRLQSGDWVLVKASRGIALDTVVGQLLEKC